MLLSLSIIAVAVVAFLCWNLSRRMAADRIQALVERRRSSSRMVSDGEFVDGNRRLKVALALTNSDLFYENADMEASLDLRSVREIEYDTGMATGQAIAGGEVLRIRSFSQVFEFVLPHDAAARWHAMLPPRQREEPTANELARGWQSR